MTQSIINVPNSLSFLRIVLTPVFLYYSLQHNAHIALCILLIAGFTDWADGYFARIMDQQSRFGEMLDPFADKILLISSYIGFYFLGFVSLPLMMIVVGRDLLLVLTGIFIVSQKLNVPISPSRLSKLNTLFQIMHIGLILLAIPSVVTSITGKIVFITTLLSGFTYAYRFYLWYTKKA